MEAVADLTQQPKITPQPEVIPARVMEVAQQLIMVVQAVTDLAQAQAQVQEQARAQAQEREPEVTAAEGPERAVAAQPLQA